MRTGNVGLTLGEDLVLVVKPMSRKRRAKFEKPRKVDANRIKFLNKVVASTSMECDSNTFNRRRFWSRVRGVFRKEITDALHNIHEVLRDVTPVMMMVQPEKVMTKQDVTISKASRSRAVRVDGDGHVRFCY
jgi:hypothetical protein